MQATMKIKEEKVLQFQELVKAFGLYFKGNPLYYNGIATITVDADHLPMAKCNEFFSTWYRMNTNIREIPQKSKFKNFLYFIYKLFKLTFLRNFTNIGIHAVPC